MLKSLLRKRLQCRRTRHAPPEEHHAADEPHVEQPEPAYAEAHAQEEPAAYEPVHEEPAYEDPAHVQQQSADHHEPVEEWVDAPQEHAPAVAHHAEAYVEPVAEPAHQKNRSTTQRTCRPLPSSPSLLLRRRMPLRHRPDDVISQVEEIWAEVDAPVRRAASEPVTEAVMPAAASVPAPFGHPVEQPAAAKAPAADKAFAWDADVFEELEAAVPAPAVKPAQPGRQMPDNAFDDVDLFADVHSSPRATPKNDGDGWRELKELAGFDKFADGGRGGGSSIPPDLDQAMASKLRGKSFRMEPKRRRFSVTGVVLTLLGLAIVAGGGYAAWLNREALNKMVADLISSAPKTATSTAPASDTANNNAAAPAATAPAASTPATTAPAQSNNAAARPPARPAPMLPRSTTIPIRSARSSPAPVGQRHRRG